MSDAELRFRVTGDQDVKRTLAEIRSEGRAIRDEMARNGKQSAEPLNRSLRETKKEAADLARLLKAAEAPKLNLDLRTARQLLESMNGDANRFKATLRLAGATAGEASNTLRLVHKEMAASGKEAVNFTKAIRDGNLQAQAMAAVLGKGKQALEAMQRLGKVKGLTESTEDAIELQKQYDKLQNKLNLMDDPATFAKVRQNIETTSIRRNVPQSALIAGTLEAQEKKSAGRELALDNGGSLLDQLAKSAYGDYMESGQIPESVAAQVTLFKNLKLKSAGELATVQGITRAGEEKGALSAVNVATKGGGVIAQMMGLQGTEGIPAYRKGQALLQTIGDAPGIDGNVDTAVNRAENLLAKLADPNTRERAKEAAGINIMDGNGKLRDLTPLMAEFALAEQKGTLAIPKSAQDAADAEKDPKKGIKFKDFFEIFKDMQAREGFLAVYRNREKYKELENVDPATGARILDRGFEFRANSKEGQLDEIARRDEVTHGRKLNEKFGAIRTVSDLTSQAQAEFPKLSAAAGLPGDIVGAFGSPGAKTAVDGIMYSVLAGLTGSQDSNPRLKMAQEEKKADIARLNAESAKIRKELEDAVKSGMENSRLNITNNITMPDGSKQTVTGEARTTKETAAGKTQRGKRPGVG